jgi:hypothetical protein
VRGEKNAAGQPLLDPRTVALLVAQGGFGDTAAVEALLYMRHRGNGSRYPLVTAEATYAWLAAALKGYSKPAKGSAEAVAGVVVAVRKCPTLLHQGVVSKRRSWDFLQEPAPAGLPAPIKLYFWHAACQG